MDKSKVVLDAILSVDQNHMNDHYKDSYVLRKLFYGETLTPEHMQTVRRVCRGEYPGGEIVAVIDRGKACNFKDGFLFTDEGFYPTVSILTESVGSKKRGVPPMKYGDIAGVDVMKKYGGDTFVQVTAKDGRNYAGYASIYAPYICEVLKKIVEALKDAEKNAACQAEKAEPAPKEQAEEKPQSDGKSSSELFDAGTAAMEEKRFEDAARYFKQAANKGSLGAVYSLAAALGMKAETLEEYEEALRYLQYYKKNGGQQDTDDLAKLLFKYYYLRKGTKLSEEDKWDEAEENWLKSAQLGSEKAMLFLAAAFMTHNPTEERLKKAQYITEKYRSLTKDDEQADHLQKGIQGKRALLLMQEAMEKEDYETVQKAAEEAAMCGEKTAMYLLALMLADQDRERAQQWLQRFGQAGGDPARAASLRQKLQEESLVQKGLQLVKEDKREEAIPLFRQAAEDGDVAAMYLLAAQLLLSGDKLPTLRDGLSWAKKFQEHLPGEDADQLVRYLEVSICILEGEEAEQRDDVQKATQCYERAWSFKESRGLLRIAIMLGKRAESEADFQEALKWAKRYQGCADNEGADKLLEDIETCRLARAGAEAAKNNKNGEAISLFRKAARRGHNGAKRLLAELLSETGMTKADFDEAHYWAREIRNEDEEKGAALAGTVTMRMMKALSSKDSSEIFAKYPGAGDVLRDVLEDYRSLQKLYEEGKAEIDAGYIDEGIQLLRRAVNEGFSTAIPLLAKTLSLDKGGKADIQEAIYLLKKYEKNNKENGIGLLANAIGIAKVKYALTPELCKDLSSDVLRYIRSTYPDLYKHLRKNGYIK